MSIDKNRAVAEALLAGLGSGASPDVIADLFHPDVIFEVPGDVGALPWIGRRTGRVAVTDFISENRLLVRLSRFDVLGILSDETKAVILGELAGVIVSTDRPLETRFAIILSLSDGQVVHFLMLEDSFRVSAAARR